MSDNVAHGIYETTEQRVRPVRVWLYVMAFLVLLMVAIGGITRLTDSGLSIVEWKPISGTIPPLSVADWEAELEAYRQIPEYQLQNRGMSLDEFKFIFWWEWGHRFFGRFLGVAFLIPFVVFLVQKRLDKTLTVPLASLFVLGGFQGFLGWWMVSSGLTERTDVSQYRLAVHLGAACILFAALIWVARRLEPANPERMRQAEQVSGRWRWLILGLGVFLYIQLIAGAFVAGINAGYSHNTWPLMDGRIIPNGLFIITPAWLNIFENPLTVQFVHRMLAYVLAIFTGYLLWRGYKANGFKGLHGWLPMIASLIALQIVLGISTLLLVVPISLALGHQALAFMLIGCITAYIADMKVMR